MRRDKPKNKQSQEKKEKKKKPNYVKVCPKCRSLDVYQETPGASLNIIFGMPTQYKCRNCGFTSYIFPEINFNEIKETAEKKKDKKSIS
jgi:hypothetical protein